jgi:hypothetical protein
MIGANVSIGAGSGKAPSGGGGGEPPAGMSVTVGVVSEAPSVYAGYSDGTLLGATGALVGTLRGLSPIFVTTIDSITDQMQLYFTGDQRAVFAGMNLAVDGVTKWTDIQDGAGMQFNGSQTIILSVTPPDELWTDHIGETYVFTEV